MAAKSGKTQADKFREAAWDLGCNDSEAAFDRALGAVAKAPPPPKQEPKRKPKSKLKKKAPAKG